MCGEKTNSYRILLTRSVARRTVGNPDIDTVIILRCILKKWDGGGYVLGSVGSRQGHEVGCCEHCNGWSGSIK